MAAEMRCTRGHVRNLLRKLTGRGLLSYQSLDDSCLVDTTPQADALLSEAKVSADAPVSASTLDNAGHLSLSPELLWRLERYRERLRVTTGVSVSAHEAVELLLKRGLNDAGVEQTPSSPPATTDGITRPLARATGDGGRSPLDGG